MAAFGTHMENNLADHIQHVDNIEEIAGSEFTASQGDFSDERAHIDEALLDSHIENVIPTCDDETKEWSSLQNTDVSCRCEDSKKESEILGNVELKNDDVECELSTYQNKETFCESNMKTLHTVDISYQSDDQGKDLPIFEQSCESANTDDILREFAALSNTGDFSKYDSNEQLVMRPATHDTNVGTQLAIDALVGHEETAPLLDNEDERDENQLIYSDEDERASSCDECVESMSLNKEMCVGDIDEDACVEEEGESTKDNPGEEGVEYYTKDDDSCSELATTDTCDDADIAFEDEMTSDACTLQKCHESCPRIYPEELDSVGETEQIPDDHLPSECCTRSDRDETNDNAAFVSKNVSEELNNVKHSTGTTLKVLQCDSGPDPHITSVEDSNEAVQYDEGVHDEENPVSTEVVTDEDACSTADTSDHESDMCRLGEKPGTEDVCEEKPATQEKDVKLNEDEEDVSNLPDKDTLSEGVSPRISSWWGKPPNSGRPQPSESQMKKASAKKAEKAKQQLELRAGWKAVFTTSSMSSSKTLCQAKQKRVAMTSCGMKARRRRSNSGIRSKRLVDSAAAKSAANCPLDGEGSLNDQNDGSVEIPEERKAEPSVKSKHKIAPKKAMQPVSATQRLVSVAVTDSLNLANTFSKRSNIDLALINDLRERRYALKSTAHYLAKDGMLHIAVKGPASHLPLGLLKADCSSDSSDDSVFIRLEVVEEKADKPSRSGNKPTIPQPVLLGRKAGDVKSVPQVPADRNVIQKRANTPSFDTALSTSTVNPVNLVLPPRKLLSST